MRFDLKNIMELETMINKEHRLYELLLQNKNQEEKNQTWFFWKVIGNLNYAASTVVVWVEITKWILRYFGGSG